MGSINLAYVVWNYKGMYGILISWKMLWNKANGNF